MKYNYGAFHSIESQNFPCTNTSKSPNYIFSRDCSRQLQCPLYRDCCLLAVDNSSLSGVVRFWGKSTLTQVSQVLKLTLKIDHK